MTECAALPDSDCQIEINNSVGEGCDTCNTDYYLDADGISCHAISGAVNCFT